MDKRSWYYVKDNKREGPITESELRKMLEDGHIEPEVLVWSESMTEWVPAKDVATFQKKAPPFSEKGEAIPIKNTSEVSPWARWWARQLDYALSLAVTALLISLAPPSLFKDDPWFVMELGGLFTVILCILVIIGAVLAVLIMWIPIEALLLTTWGTTPGKWLLGITVRDSLGNKLTFRKALERSNKVYEAGMGIGFLPVTLVTWVLAYRNLTQKGITSWDHKGGWVVSQERRGGVKVFAFIGFFIASFACVFYATGSILEKSRAWYEVYNLSRHAVDDQERYLRDIKAYQQALQLAPNSAETHYNLGIAYSRLERYKEAIESYQQAINIKPDFAEAYAHLGMAYAELGRHKEAMEACQKAIKLKPNSSLVHASLASAYTDLGQYEEAIKAYQQAIKIEPDYAVAYGNMGMVYILLGKYQEAVDALKQAIKIDSDTAPFYSHLGIAYTKLGRHKEAIEACQQAIKIKPNFSAYHTLGIAYTELGQYYKAIDAYKLAIRIEPNSALSYNSLGGVYLKLERPQEALEACQQAVRIKPDMGEAYGNLGLAYMKLGRYDETIEACKRAIKITPGYLDAYLILGMTYHQLGQYQKAVDIFKQALKQSPENPHFLFGLGMAYLALGNKGSALKQYRILTKVDARLADQLFNKIYPLDH